MEWLYSFTPPIAPAELRLIEEMLRSRDVFVAGFDPNHRDPYSIGTYIEKQEIYRQPVSLFVDRNVVTRLVSLIDGADAEAEHRVAAAVLVFAQICQLLIEPSIAVHEYASTAGERKARRELRRFYQADSVDATLWASIALGKTSRMERIKAVPRRINHRLDRTLYRWQRNYIAVLKIAELELAGGSSEGRMTAFIDWMYHDFLLAGAATILAAQYFAPGTPKKGLLKHLRSSDRNVALEGIRNASWDLMLLSDWLQRLREVTEGSGVNAHPVLCTFDKGVVRIARSLVLFAEDDFSPNEILNRTFHGIWGEKAGSRLAKRYSDYIARTDDPARHFNKTQGLGFIPAMIEAGEEAILNHVL